MQTLVAFLLAVVSVASASTWGVWPWGVHAGAHWAAPHAAPVVLPSGHLADTPEVAAAKGAHLAELARQGGSTGAWHGHWAAPAVLPSGHIADTPEVAAAKSAHLAEVARQAGGAWAGHGGVWAGHGGAWAGHGAWPAAHGAWGPWNYAAAHEGQYVPDQNGW